MQTGYQCFARYYDILTSNVDYHKRAEYFHKIISTYSNKSKGLLLELACGTGSLCEAMSKIGYDVIGTDYSQEMLTVALDKKIDSGENIQYLCQDMRELDMFGTIDITICALDGLNHLNCIEDVAKVFERVSLFSEKDGLFIFDMNTQYKHSSVLADNVFAYDEESVYCVWQNSFNSEDYSVEITLDFFEEVDGLYQRFSESFSETAYTTSEIDELLVANNFEVIAHFDDDSFDLPHEKSERIIYVAKKK